MEMSDDPRSRGPAEAPPALPPGVTPMKGSSYSAVQQQGYSASIFLKRKDKLEKVRRAPLRHHAAVWSPVYLSFGGRGGEIQALRRGTKLLEVRKKFIPRNVFTVPMCVVVSCEPRRGVLEAHSFCMRAVHHWRIATGEVCNWALLPQMRIDYHSLPHTQCPRTNTRKGRKKESLNRSWVKRLCFHFIFSVSMFKHLQTLSFTPKHVL